MSNDPSNALHPLPTDDATLIPSSVLPHYIGVAPQTLARWRYEGNGPAFVKVGRKVLYEAGKVRQWLQLRRAQSTSG
jgi:hypothetical protein